MYKLFVLAALVAVAVGAPAPGALIAGAAPAVATYTAGVPLAYNAYNAYNGYNAPLSYGSPIAYSAGYSALPTAYRSGAYISPAGAAYVGSPLAYNAHYGYLH